MNVEVVQRRLWEQSQKHREHRESSTPLFPVNKYDGRVRNLMDLMHQPQWIAAACDRVLQRSRGKATGVDRVTAAKFERNRRAELEKLTPGIETWNLSTSTASTRDDTQGQRKTQRLGHSVSSRKDRSGSHSHGSRTDL